MNNKYQFPGCCALPVCFFHICSCLCPTRPFLESPLSARPTPRTWRKRLGLQLPVKVPNNWRAAACRGRSCPREPRSHAPTFSACFSGLLPCPSTRPAIGRLAIGWCPAPLQGFAPCPHHRTAHRPRTRTALKSKGREKNRAAPPLCYPPTSTAEQSSTREQEHSPVRCAQTFARPAFLLPGSSPRLPTSSLSFSFSIATMPTSNNPTEFRHARSGSLNIQNPQAQQQPAHANGIMTAMPGGSRFDGPRSPPSRSIPTLHSLPCPRRDGDDDEGTSHHAISITSCRLAPPSAAADIPKTLAAC